MKLGVVGYGMYFRKVYLPYLLSRPEVELTAVCDLFGSDEFDGLIDGAGFARRPALFAEVGTMLDSVDLDAAVISTPHVLHFRQAEVCLCEGLHVFVDKPLTCRLEEARELVKLADEKGLRLAVGCQRRYERPYEHVREALQEGRLGEIRLINYLCANSPWGDYSRSWRGDPALSGGGALMDIGYLAVDTVVWLLDRPLRRVYAVASTPPGLRVEQSVVLVAEFEPDIPVNMTISYETTPPSVQEELSVFCTGGSIFTRRIQAKRSPHPPDVVEHLHGRDAQSFHCEEAADNSRPLAEFLRSIATGAPHRCGGKDHLPILEMIESAYTSIQERRVVEVSRSGARAAAGRSRS